MSDNDELIKKEISIIKQKIYEVKKQIKVPFEELLQKLKENIELSIDEKGKLKEDMPAAMENILPESLHSIITSIIFSESRPLESKCKNEASEPPAIHDFWEWLTECQGWMNNMSAWQKGIKNVFNGPGTTIPELKKMIVDLNDPGDPPTEMPVSIISKLFIATKTGTTDGNS
jgi:hypothetical protein